jgi:hypothetical protein
MSKSRPFVGRLMAFCRSFDGLLVFFLDEMSQWLFDPGPVGFNIKILTFVCFVLILTTVSFKALVKYTTSHTNLLYYKGARCLLHIFHRQKIWRHYFSLYYNWNRTTITIFLTIHQRIQYIKLILNCQPSVTLQICSWNM